MSGFTAKEIDGFLNGEVEGTAPYIIKQQQAQIRQLQAQVEWLANCMASESMCSNKQEWIDEAMKQTLSAIEKI